MTTATVDLSKMNTQQLLAYIAQKEQAEAADKAKIAQLEKAAQEQASYSIKIGRSGTVSVSGFGRYPVSLYMNQWRDLLKLAPGIDKFITEHAAEIEERANAPIAEGAPNPSASFKLKMAA